MPFIYVTERYLSAIKIVFKKLSKTVEIPSDIIPWIKTWPINFLMFRLHYDYSLPIRYDMTLLTA